MESNLEDRISTLPDDILVSVISLLKLKEAIKTSVLSRRWLCLWKYTTGVLDFVKPFSTDDASHVLPFVNWVSRVLDLHKGVTIDEFRSCLMLDVSSSDLINNWIQIALKKHVKRLYLDAECNLGCFADYALKRHVFSSYRGSLTMLHLNRVEVTGYVLCYIVSNSPLLQVLHVEKSDSLVELKIETPLPTLRCLEIMGCRFMRCLEVHASNLVSFTYCGPNRSICFKEIPRLIHASTNCIFYFEGIHHLSSCFSHLESLVLDLRGFFHMSRSRCPKLLEFKKLKQLEVTMSGFNGYSYLDYCTKLLEASPLLEIFVLKIRGMLEREYGTPRKVKYQHNLLKVVEIVGFYGHEKYVKLVRDLLAMVPNLQKLIVDTIPICPLRNLEEWDSAGVRDSAYQLQNLLPSGVELIIR